MGGVYLHYAWPDAVTNGELWLSAARCRGMTDAARSGQRDLQSAVVPLGDAVCVSRGLRVRWKTWQQPRRSRDVKNPIRVLGGLGQSTSWKGRANNQDTQLAGRSLRLDSYDVMKANRFAGREGCVVSAPQLVGIDGIGDIVRDEIESDSRRRLFRKSATPAKTSLHRQRFTLS